jgi:hypothetical protein
MAAGSWTVVLSAAVALLAAFALRSRLPAPLVTLVLVAAGAGLAWGAMLLQPDPSASEFVAAMLILAALVPVHVRILLGPFGPR